MVDWTWLPATWSRIVEPFLDPLDPQGPASALEAGLEAGLEGIRRDPYSPATFPWNGRSPVIAPQTTRMAIIRDP